MNLFEGPVAPAAANAVIPPHVEWASVVAAEAARARAGRGQAEQLMFGRRGPAMRQVRDPSRYRSRDLRVYDLVSALAVTTYPLLHLASGIGTAPLRNIVGRLKTAGLLATESNGHGELTLITATGHPDVPGAREAQARLAGARPDRVLLRSDAIVTFAFDETTDPVLTWQDQTYLSERRRPAFAIDRAAIASGRYLMPAAVRLTPDGPVIFFHVPTQQVRPVNLRETAIATGAVSVHLISHSRDDLAALVDVDLPTGPPVLHLHTPPPAPVTRFG